MDHQPKLLSIVTILVMAVLAFEGTTTFAQEGSEKGNSSQLSLVKASLPRYPRLAKVAKIEAILDFEMSVNEVGRVIGIKRLSMNSKPTDILWEYVDELVRSQWLFHVDGKGQSNLVRAQFIFELLPPQRDNCDCREPHVDIQLRPMLRVSLTDYQIRAQ